MDRNIQDGRKISSIFLINIDGPVKSRRPHSRLTPDVYNMLCAGFTACFKSPVRTSRELSYQHVDFMRSGPKAVSIRPRDKRSGSFSDIWPLVV